ncbi:MAG: cell wall metabolism sensor histidine kinase WalK [Spirochaetaceae bacterium]|nr:cell wall metabolism sensor histidine kinase WalK [Spirochaetaceae bacterium]
MKRITLFFQLFSIQFILVFALLFVATFLSTKTLTDIINTNTETHQKAMTTLIVNMLPEKEFQSIYDAQNFADSASAGTGKRLTLIDYEGNVIADSHNDSHTMENNLDREEVQEALRGGMGQSRRYSIAMGEEMFFIAIPVPSKNLIVRTAISVEDIKRQLEHIYRRLALVVGIIFILASLVAYLIAKNISNIINSIKNVAEHYAAGDFSVSLKAAGNLELFKLGRSINSMGNQLKEKINTITSQKNELKAILINMVEPVILFDENMDIKEINPAALDIINPQNKIKTNKLSDMLKNKDITRIIKRSLKTRKYQEEIICFNEKENLYYLVHVSFIKRYGKEKNRALLVMNDISGIKRLEKMRKEFAANVSHELKTPVTSIIGYVETLMADENLDKDNVRQFLSVISRQSIRLEKIIEDLLTLSTLDNEHTNFDKEKIPVADLIGSSVSACSYLAEQKNIEIMTECSEDLELYAHPVLAEQAVSNLIDNALKYSYPNSVVKVNADISKYCIVITVSDSGPGIPKKNLDRIFDRFYRVDKSRSRELGGTGLGLAIVKSIARIHGGKVTVESTLGVGSSFKLYFSNDRA